MATLRGTVRQRSSSTPAGTPPVPTKGISPATRPTLSYCSVTTRDADVTRGCHERASTHRVGTLFRAPDRGPHDSARVDHLACLIRNSWRGRYLHHRRVAGELGVLAY